MTEQTHPDHHNRHSRRVALRAALAGAGVLTAGALGAAPAFGAPALVRGGRPVLTHGVQTGEVSTRSALVWARADRPSRMVVEVARDPSFARARLVRGPLLTPETDGTGTVRLPGLVPGGEVYYRVRAVDLDGRVASEPVTGRFRTAPVWGRDVRLVWSGDVAGQGWGINPDIGGMTAYAAMAAREPDLFLHSGDTVYADGPLAESVTLPDGRVWRNLVTPEKAKVAETLAEYRGQFAYNLLDENVRAFTAAVPVSVQWDDHEVVNNWYPGEILDLPQYAEKRVDVLAARAARAFREWHPLGDGAPGRDSEGRIYRSFRYGPHVEVFVLDMRSHRDPNTADRTKPGRILGRQQAHWLVRELARSKATWKIIQSDMPVGLIVPDGDDIEGVANGLPGAPAGRESEIAWVLREITRRRVRNTVWLTADVHYTAAHHYSPDRAAVGNFDPFWEFVSGPLNAGAFGPNTLDPTFGPEAVFVHAPPAANTSPMDGFQHFGELNVDGLSGELRVDLRDGSGASLWSRTLRPQRR
ncbi:alkaline phosphatase D [Amycolatopsis marina]|uniref:Alkaline phosphatase D n=1 Tax=Amycolatopsis marina TaxID=490629 RepID=A0A1I0ZP08_9PSEU|nr:alkaline phosphatase D family protein [Amycolatopsis marina]SFB27102.1 alkaline phosphatase D [Amycolatopsis marina]